MNTTLKRLALAALIVAGVIGGGVAAVTLWPSSTAAVAPAVQPHAPQPFAAFMRTSSVTSTSRSHLGFLDSGRFLGDSFSLSKSFLTPAAPAAGGFSGMVALIGDSNAVGAANFSATGQQDSGYGVTDVNGAGYAAVQMDSQWSQSITNPVTWLTVTGNLRAYDVGGTLNVGSEQTLGRRMVELGLHASPIINKFALSGSTQHTHWRTDSTFPNNPANLHSQMMSYLLAREAATGKRHDVIVVVLGENDTSSSTNANATQVDLGNIFDAIRSGLGRPTQLIYLIIINSSTTGANAATVISQQLAYVAADPYARAIRVDDIPLASNPHYGANGYYTVGDRIAQQINVDFFSDTPRNRGSGPAPWLEDWGSSVTIAAAGSGTPRSGSEERDGDYQLLVVTGQSAAATYSLTTAAGFTGVCNGGAMFESVFGGTNHRSMQVWERIVTSAGQTNNGRMPVPTVSATGVQSSVANIVTIRGPNKFTVSPLDFCSTGANNANSTALSIAGGTTATANELVLYLTSIPATSNTGPLVSTVANSNVSGITIARQSIGNQASFIGVATASGTVASASTAIGNTTVTMAAAGVNVGAALAIKP